MIGVGHGDAADVQASRRWLGSPPGSAGSAPAAAGRVGECPRDPLIEGREHQLGSLNGSVPGDRLAGFAGEAAFWGEGDLALDFPQTFARRPSAGSLQSEP